MRTIGTIGLAAFAAGMLATATAAAQQITISSGGGAWQAAQREAWYKPFAAKMGVKFNEEETSEGMARVQAMIQAHNMTNDVVTVDTSEVQAACDSGIIQHLDWSKIAPRDGFLLGSALDCGMGLDVYGDVLAYMPRLHPHGVPRHLQDAAAARRRMPRQALRRHRRGAMRR